MQPQGRKGVEVGGLKKHHSSASLPAITLEMKCWFSFVLIFSKCGRVSANTSTLTMPRGVMCVKQDAFLEVFSALENVFKKLLNLNGLTQR